MVKLTLNRRRFLLAAGCGTATAAAVGIFRFASTNGASIDLDSRLEEFIASGNFSPGLGAQYLMSRDLPVDTAREFLLEARASIGEEGDIDSIIRGQILSDFVRGDVCELNGWQLSATECRLAAVAFLLRTKGRYMEETAVRAEGPLDHLPNMTIVQLERWGPQSSRVGERFNVQPTGNSALWFRFLELDEYPDYEIYLGSQAAVTTIHAERKLVTASLTPRQSRKVTSVEGLIPIHLVDPVRGKQLIEYFRVRPAAH